jgi:hypothetical protein
VVVATSSKNLQGENSMLVRTLLGSICFLAFLCAPVACGAFNFDQYKPSDLDELLSQQRPATGTKVIAPQKLNIEVTLVGYAVKCSTGFLRQTMIMLGVPKEVVAGVAISKCIKVQSAKGQVASMYVQDAVAEFLPGEVPLGSVINVFGDFMFLSKEGPGILVNEFQSRK